MASRDGRIGLAGLRRREDAGEKPRAGDEAHLARRVAHAVEKILVMRRLADELPHLRLDPALVVDRLDEGRIDERRRGHAAIAPPCRRGAARCREDRRRAGAGDRAIAGWSGARRRPACGRRRGRARRALRRDRRCRRARRARAGTSSVSTSRARGLVIADAAAEMPAANGLRRAFRVHGTRAARSVCERFRIVGRAGEDQAADLGWRVRRPPRTTARNGLHDAAPVRSAHARKRFEVGIAAELGEARQRSGSSDGRRCVCSSATICRRCSIGAQEAIGVGELVARLSS